MSELDIIKNWHSYNARVRSGYIESFTKLPREELSRDRGASFPTMLDIFEHTMGAYWFWLKLATGNPTLPQVGPFSDTGPGPTVEEIKKFEQQVQSLVKRFLDGLVEQDLDKTFLVHSDHFDHDHIVSVRNMLWHLVEEELQHRGELNAFALANRCRSSHIRLDRLGRTTKDITLPSHGVCEPVLVRLLLLARFLIMFRAP